MTMRSLIASCLCLFSTWTVAAGEMRDWTRASDGQTVQASFVDLKDEATVRIRLLNGQVYQVPLAGLSEGDQAYVAERAAAAMAPGDAGAAEGDAASIPEGETTVVLSGVHLCCRGCEEAVEEIASGGGFPEGTSLAADRGDGTVSITAPTGKAAADLVRAIHAGGFYGESDHSAIRIPDLQEDDFTSDTMVVRDVHLCCNACVRAFTRAVESVDGVRRQNASSGASRITVEGSGFKPYEVMLALRKAGFGGRMQ